MTELIGPHINANGVPWCSDSCPQHDGKRCRILGQRPDSICEPFVVMIATERVQARDAVMRLRASEAKACALLSDAADVMSGKSTMEPAKLSARIRAWFEDA